MIEGEKLAELMIDYRVGVASDAICKIKRLDTNYFEKEL